MSIELLLNYTLFLYQKSQNFWTVLLYYQKDFFVKCEILYTFREFKFARNYIFRADVSARILVPRELHEPQQKWTEINEIGDKIPKIRVKTR